MDGRGSDRAAVLQVEELGETQITEEVFQDYLRTQGGDRFRGDRYDLFRHNCNNFSHETAQFLVGRGIPQHIVDLPGEILATPMGQMLAPMLQQMAPSGTSIPFTNNPAAPGPAPPPPSSPAPSSQPAAVSGAKLPVKEFITFDQPHKIDGLSKKLEEFNTKQPDESMFAPQLKQTVVAKAWAETTDLGKTEQLSLSISYLNNGVKKERFLMFIEVKLTQTDDLNNKLIQLQPPLLTAY